MAIIDDGEYEGTSNETFVVLASVNGGIFSERVNLSSHIVEIAIQENDIRPGTLCLNVKVTDHINALA